jgi:hypothetical protein
LGAGRQAKGLLYPGKIHSGELGVKGHGGSAGR